MKKKMSAYEWREKKRAICLAAIPEVLESEEMRAVTTLMILDKADLLTPRGQTLGSMGVAALVKVGCELPWERFQDD